MYAHVLRKWSLAKFLLLMWLPVLMLLVIWCPGADNLQLGSYMQSSPFKSNDNIYGLSNSSNDLIHTTGHLSRNNLIFRNYTGPTISSNRSISGGGSSGSSSINSFHQLFDSVTNITDQNDRLLLSTVRVAVGLKKMAIGTEQTNVTNGTIDQIRHSPYGETMDNIKTNDRKPIQTNIHGQQLSQIIWTKRLKEKRMRNDALRYRLKLINDATLLADTSAMRSVVQPEEMTSAKFIVPLNKIEHPKIQHSSSIQQQIANRNRRESRYELSRLQQQQQHNHQHHHHHNHQSGRMKSRRFCSARDPTTLAFEAPTVFEGKVRSMSSDRRRNFSVTFEVKEVYKRQLGHKLPLLVRLQFSYRNSSECDIYKETLKPRGYVRDELEPGKLYILFVQQIDIGNYTILGQPIKKTKKVVNEIRIGVNEKYDHNWHNTTSVIPVAGQRASIESLLANYSSAREGRRIRIVCRVRGQPPPKVTWFKDGRSISRNRIKYQFIHLRKRAELIIKSAIRNDSGQYECRAKNKLARQPVTRSTRIEILPREYEVTTLPNNWTHSGSSCPVIGEFFCLNGGTCVFFKDVGEPACKCPDGFLGNRCETKNPTNLQPSTYNKKDQQQCGDNKYYGSYYC